MRISRVHGDILRSYDHAASVFVKLGLTLLIALLLHPQNVHADKRRAFFEMVKLLPTPTTLLVEVTIGHPDVVYRLRISFEEKNLVVWAQSYPLYSISYGDTDRRDSVAFGENRFYVKVITRFDPEAAIYANEIAGATYDGIFPLHMLSEPFDIWTRMTLTTQYLLIGTNVPNKMESCVQCDPLALGCSAGVRATVGKGGTATAETVFSTYSAIFWRNDIRPTVVPALLWNALFQDIELGISDPELYRSLKFEVFDYDAGSTLKNSVTIFIEPFDIHEFSIEQNPDPASTEIIFGTDALRFVQLSYIASEQQMCLRTHRDSARQAIGNIYLFVMFLLVVDFIWLTARFLTSVFFWRSSEQFEWFGLGMNSIPLIYIGSISFSTAVNGFPMAYQRPNIFAALLMLYALAAVEAIARLYISLLNTRYMRYVNAVDRSEDIHRIIAEYTFGLRAVLIPITYTYFQKVNTTPIDQVHPILCAGILLFTSTMWWFAVLGVGKLNVKPWFVGLMTPNAIIVIILSYSVYFRHVFLLQAMDSESVAFYAYLTLVGVTSAIGHSVADNFVNKRYEAHIALLKIALAERMEEKIVS